MKPPGVRPEPVVEKLSSNVKILVIAEHFNALKSHYYPPTRKITHVLLRNNLIYNAIDFTRRVLL